MRTAGFTLLEVMLSIAAIGLIAGMSMPVYQALQMRNSLDVAATEVATSARRAQMLSQAADGDTSWGIHVATGNLTLFQGTSYAGRDSTRDESFDVPNSITPSGLAEVVYAKFTGLPQNTGTIVLMSSAGETRTITINAKGMVNY